MTQEARDAKELVDDVAAKAKDAVDTTRDKVDDTASRAKDALNATREKTKDAIDDAEAKVQSIRDDLRPSIDALSARVQDFAERTKQAAFEKRDQTKETVQAYADKTSAYVVDQPLKSVAIAAAAGAVLALVLGRRR